jgi:hypothetical protein|tara:strand:+ start:1956 stop:2087 length:132 start_codon:yes stop_codon:yes gene_type:complete
MEILVGIILGVYWHILSERNKAYEEHDWEKIKNDWLNDKFDDR